MSVHTEAQHRIEKNNNESVEDLAPDENVAEWEEEVISQKQSTLLVLQTTNVI